MDNVFHFYDIYPKLLKAGEEHTITIKALDRHCFFKDGEPYTIHIVPMNHIAADDCNPPYPAVSVTAHDHQLSFAHFFDEEQRYALHICKDETELFHCCVYAVDSDLYGLIPLKGNMHAHSFRSDGIESPELVAANYRTAGFDFLAITDHANYAPSIEAIDFFGGINMDYLLLPGEEIHTPRNKIHILGIAGTDSVNDYYRTYPEQFEEEVAAIRNELALANTQEDFEYASSVWAFRKIKEYGGLSVLAHPNWIVGRAYNIAPAQYRKFLKEKPFDALELVNGGDSPAENTEQLAIWHDACTNGCHVPVIATDDSHGTVNGTWFDIGFTYVFAKSNTKEDLLDAMKKGRCVAVERYKGEAPRFYGDYRLVSISSFLYHEYFPIHDKLCAREGSFLTDYVSGSKKAPAILSMLKGGIPALHQKYFNAGV